MKKFKDKLRIVDLSLAPYWERRLKELKEKRKMKLKKLLKFLLFLLGILLFISIGTVASLYIPIGS